MKPSATNTRRTILRRTTWLLALLASLLVLAACSPGGDDDDVVTGSLAIDVMGLPDGVDADVTVTGPEGAEGDALIEETVTEDGTLANLAPGEYTVEAAGVVTDEGVAYAPTDGASTVTVTAGETTAVDVAYEEVGDAASLTITVTGLPEGASADVDVAGPDGFTENVTATETLVALEPGEYTITADAVEFEGTTYTGTVSQSPVTLAADGEGAVTVTYEADTTEAVPGEPDTAFGEAGTTMVASAVTASEVRVLEPLADGSFLVAASGTNDVANTPGDPLDDEDVFVVTRIDAAGDVDTTFGTDGAVSFDATGEVVALDAAVIDGAYVVAAVTDDGAGTLMLEMRTVETDGTVVTTATASTAFDAAGATAEIEAVTDVDLLTDGSVAVAGYGDFAGDTQDLDTDLAIAHFGPDGTLDTTFADSDGVLFVDQGGADVAHGVLPLSDDAPELTAEDSFVVFGEAGATDDFTAIHVSFDGGLMSDFSAPDGTSFDYEFTGTTSAAYAAAQAPDGDIVLAGTAGGDFALVRLTYVADADDATAGEQPAWVLDETFGTSGSVTTDVGGDDDVVTALEIADDGTILAAGTSTTADPAGSAMVLARYDADGTPDAGFGDGGVATADFAADAEAHAVAHTDTHVLVGGDAGGDAAIAAFFR